MGFMRTKATARRLGLYRVARWVHLHTLNRARLRQMKEDLAYYRQCVPEGSLCFDVGANYGDKSEVFLKLGARVIAFEPQPDCMAELRARLGAHSRLVTIAAAVGSEPGHGTLFLDSYTPASSLVKGWQGAVVGTVDVPITTLDAAIAVHGLPHFCKIDVEGYELEVLKGLSHPIPIISFEYHLRDDAQKALACIDRLSQFGAIELNVSPAEKAVFAREEWWNLADFTRFFRNDLPKREGYEYGDIFVKLVGERDASRPHIAQVP